MGKYDNLPHVINQVKNDITLKEAELAKLKQTLASLNAKAKPAKVEVKAPKVEVKTHKVDTNE